MVDNAMLFIPFKAIQKCILSISFHKQRKSIRLDFAEKSLSAILTAIIAVAAISFDGAFPIFAPVFVWAFAGIASVAVVVFGT